MNETMSIEEILEYIRVHGLHKGNFEELVPEMIRACCKDEYADAAEEFIKAFDEIDWDWYPNG